MCEKGACGAGTGLPDGSSCASASECASGSCTNGICGSGSNGTAGSGGAAGTGGAGGAGGSTGTGGTCPNSDPVITAGSGGSSSTSTSLPPVVCGSDGGESQDQLGCDCTPGTSRACYTGPAGTRGVGSCHDGTQTCLSQGELTGTYDVCVGAVTDCTPPPSLCADKVVNNEPEILAAYSPAPGEAVAKNGQIKVWVNDEWPPFISQGEQVDPNTGAVLTPGDRAGKAPDGYLFEPALYISPDTAESGGTPHFPQWIKGQYNNDPAAGKPKGGGMMMGTGPFLVQGAAVDAVPSGTPLREKYLDEYVWDVCALGLGPGTYTAEFVIIDGDQDRAIGCVTIVIAP